MSKKETKKPENETVGEAEVSEQEVEVTETEQASEPSALEKLQQEIETLNDRLLRTLAEYDNYRKRSQKEKEASFGDTRAGVIAGLLPIIDNFERAMQNKDASAEDYQKGIDMIFTQFSDFLKNMGVESFGEVGEKFDPNIHNAVMHVEDENEEESSVIEVFSKGYKMGERIIRPAMVKVAN